MTYDKETGDVIIHEKSANKKTRIINNYDDLEKEKKSLNERARRKNRQKNKRKANMRPLKKSVPNPTPLLSRSSLSCTMSIRLNSRCSAATWCEWTWVWSCRDHLSFCTWGRGTSSSWNYAHRLWMSSKRIRKNTLMSSMKLPKWMKVWLAMLILTAAEWTWITSQLTRWTMKSIALQASTTN